MMRTAAGPTGDADSHGSVYVFLEFLDAPHLLEIFEAACQGVSARRRLPDSANDDDVIEAVCRVSAAGMIDVGLAREELLHSPPRLTERGRRLLEYLDRL